MLAPHPDLKNEVAELSATFLFGFISFSILL